MLALTAAQAAYAAKPSVVGKIPGSAFVLKADPSSSWVACWSAQADGKFKLMAVNGDNGDKLEVTTVDRPGGLCWIPGRGKLLYCKGIYNDKLKNTKVVYAVYDLAAKKATNLIPDLIDLKETYLLDPIASEDGKMVFILTINTIGLPSFNIYFPEANSLTSTTVSANIGSDFDLSSDGSKLYWYLHNPDNGNFNIVGWSFQDGSYSDLFEFTADRDPGDDHALFKLDSPRSWAATMVTNESDPTLQLCVYDFHDPQNLGIIPVRLPAGEDVMYFDWKGRSGTLYALCKNSKTGEYSIHELEPLEGTRTELLRGKEEITLVDYSPKAQCYFYSLVDDRNAKKPTTSLVRLK